MNSADLLAILGGGAPPGAGSSSRRGEAEGKSILSFKAGRMDTKVQMDGRYMITPDDRRGMVHLTWASSAGGTLKFEWRDRRTRSAVETVTIHPSPTGGGDVGAWTFGKVETGKESDRVFLLQSENAPYRRHFYWMQDAPTLNETKEDLTHNSHSSEGVDDTGGDGGDESNCVKMNAYLADATEAAKAAGDVSTAAGGRREGGVGDISRSRRGTAGGGLDTSGLVGGDTGLDNASLVRIMQGLGAPPRTDAESGGGDGGVSGNSVSRSSSSSSSFLTPGMTTASRIPGVAATPETTTGGVDGSIPVVGSDVLSGILAGMSTSSTQSQQLPPPPSSLPTSNIPTTPAVGGEGSATNIDTNVGTLTLDDLRGAMAGLATASPPPPPDVAAVPPGPPLDVLLSHDAVSGSGLLDNPDVRKRLVSLLPEGQRTNESLEENLRSPQVTQCLQGLSATLTSNEDTSGFVDLVANFQMNPEDGAEAMAAGNPIGAFLDCIVKKVERKHCENGDTEMKDSVKGDELEEDKGKSDGGEDKGDGGKSDNSSGNNEADEDAEMSDR